MDSPTPTTLSQSTSESRLAHAFGSGVTWLEVKRRKRGVVTKRRKIIPLPAALAMERKSISTVTYFRTAYQGEGWRITLDREVRHKNCFLTASLHDREVPVVVVEVKGNPPKWILKALGAPNKTFSKSRWSTAADAR